MGFLASKVYRVSHLEMLPAIELAQRLYIFTRNFYIRKKKKEIELVSTFFIVKGAFFNSYFRFQRW